MLNAPTISTDYWKSLDIERQDIEGLQNYLFDTETPLTTSELLKILVDSRVRAEHEARLKKQRGEGKIYLPKERYEIGERLVFPAMDWKKGKVLSVRPGINPELGPFDVVQVEFEDGTSHDFATCLEDHRLNRIDLEADEKPSEPPEPEAESMKEMETRLERTLSDDENLVRIAGRWFPRALLVDVSVGNLNLAEAVLEMAGGEPMSTEKLMEQLDLPAGVNPRLVEFSLNYALQEDPRFDEVGPAGQVLWCLRRTEPDDVQTVPTFLAYRKIEYDSSLLTKQMLALDAEVDDELSDIDHDLPRTNEVTICLTYPHWRSGTLPISQRLEGFLPTAYESARIRFTLVDARSGQRLPAWVVREHRYVSGLQSWFRAMDLFPGALVTIKHGRAAGEVLIEARTRRPSREWVRTVLTGSDGGIVFAMLRQQVSCDFNERMTAIIPDVSAVEAAASQSTKARATLEQIIVMMIKELSKLTPQGHVHALELYSAINILRRIPPGPMLAFLAGNTKFKHVGDLYYRISSDESEEA